MAKKPVALIILDGFGYNPTHKYNAVAGANKPYFDGLVAKYKNGTIRTDGLNVGLPEGQMGNSEVGHTNIGAGRIVYQELTRISKSIKDGDFFTNEVLVENVKKAVDANKNVHIFGLVSDGGVHSHQEHIAAAIELAAKEGAKQVLVHAFLDGRDVSPKSAEEYLSFIDGVCQKVKVAKIATITGRYYAMDRDNRWERVEQAYNAVIGYEAQFTTGSWQEALNNAYAREETDEFVKATQIGETVKMQDGDTILFMNFRADRAREISYPFTDDNFSGFERKAKVKVNFVQLTQFDAKIASPVAFKKQSLENTLGEWLEKKHKTQLRAAETEKYPHVTFFFSGGREEPYKGESRILAPSPKVATYDLQPEMSAIELTDKVIDAVKNTDLDFIALNYANGDMVGHTGVYEAAVKAVETLDACLSRLVPTILEVGGEVIIIADHGNAEKMWDETTNQPHSAHTTFPVPFIYVGEKALNVREGGVLADVAPTILKLMEVEQPAEMTGSSVLV